MPNIPKLKFTNLDKIFWSEEGYTKGDIIEYYQKIAPFMMPYLMDRPQNLNRHPDGIAGEHFYQKNVTSAPPEIDTTRIYAESTKEYVNYVLCNDPTELLFMVNFGCIEINPWNSRIQNLDKPDYLIFDLDPEETTFTNVVKVALTLHRILDQYGIPNFCKTSGSRGLHVYVPAGAKYTFEQVQVFAKKISELVVEQLPKLASIERIPLKRNGKVYLDYLQNRFGQATVCVYSLRPKEGAPVSTPLEWQEVNEKLDPKNFNIKNIFKRLVDKGDLFKPVLEKGADLRTV